MLIKRQPGVQNMSRLSVEEKLQLMSRIRSDNELNHLQMNRREQLVYGKKTLNDSPLQAAQMNTEEQENDSIFSLSLKVRFFFSILILFSILWMKFGNASFGDITYERIISSLQNNAIDFENYISYTDVEDVFKEIIQDW